MTSWKIQVIWKGHPQSQIPWAYKRLKGNRIKLVDDSRNLQIVDRHKTIPFSNILVVTQLWTCWSRESKVGWNEINLSFALRQIWKLEWSGRLVKMPNLFTVVPRNMFWIINCFRLDSWIDKYFCRMYSFPIHSDVRRKNTFEIPNTSSKISIGPLLYSFNLHVIITF